LQKNKLGDFYKKKEVEMDHLKGIKGRGWVRDYLLKN